MITTILTVALLLAQSGPGWVWSFYDSDSSVALAQEVPDTSRLGVVLECTRGSGVVRISHYGLSGGAEFVTFTAGEDTATAPRLAGDVFGAPLRTDHPVFQALLAQGRVRLSSGDQSGEIAIPAAARPALVRFARACSG